MDDLRLSEVQIIVKNREQTQKIYSGNILGSILPKNEELLKYWWKQKEKEKEKYWTQRYWERLGRWNEEGMGGS